MNALKLLQPIKDKYSGVTYADLFQLASATAVEVLLSLPLESMLIKIVKLVKKLTVIKFFKISGGWWTQNPNEVWKGGCLWT